MIEYGYRGNVVHCVFETLPHAIGELCKCLLQCFEMLSKRLVKFRPCTMARKVPNLMREFYDGACKHVCLHTYKSIWQTKLFFASRTNRVEREIPGTGAEVHVGNIDNKSSIHVQHVLQYWKSRHFFFCFFCCLGTRFGL